MQLKDTKLGDTITVYLGIDGILSQTISGKLNGEWPLKATVVGICCHSLVGVSDVMLGFDDTVSFVPNNVVRNVAPHNTPGYTFLPDFHKQYRWTVWEKSNMECEAVGGKSALASTRQYPNDQCKCGIHLTLNPCDYHS